jgi:hypothetical protein
MANGFQIVSSGLFITNMSVDACISSSTSQVLSFSKWNVLSFRVFVTLCKTKVNDVYTVFVVLLTPNEEIVRLYVSVNDPFLVNFLYPLNLLFLIYI